MTYENMIRNNDKKYERNNKLKYYQMKTVINQKKKCKTLPIE